MPRHNKQPAVALCISWLLMAALMAGQNPASVQPASQSPAQNVPQQVQATPVPPDVDPADPALPLWARSKAPTGTNPSIPPMATASPAPGPLPETGEVKRSGGGFVIGVRVDEVTLQATVIDHNKRLVTGLKQSDFAVSEDGAPQRITHFKHEDIPVSMGILVDNSGSMRDKRSAVTKAVVNLVQASNTEDEVFIVNFDDEPYLDQDFTNQIPLMREALERSNTRGGTALFDAVIAAADHLKAGRREKKVLLIVTDGEDNESRETLEQCIRAVQFDNGPTIYAIGILGEYGKQRKAKRDLEALSAQTGGLAFFPKTIEEVDEISQEVARDIRNQYTITYKPSNPRINGGFR
ncbi:MAG: VWA domain-containing protein, partial [Terriglobales bacterium]